MSSFKLTGLGVGSAAGNSLRYEQLFTTSSVAVLGAMDWVRGADIASASTINLTTATGNAVHVTGTVTITAVTLGSGMWRLVIFDGALTLTHHATNNNLPGGVNITTVANDRALYWSDGTTVYCMVYEPATVTGTGSTVKAASPTFTGTPLSTTAAADTNTTQIATTAFVLGQSATQAQQETGSSTTVYVSPGRQQYHASACKAWVRVTGTGTVTIVASYNVTSVTDNGVGDYSPQFTVAFSASTSYSWTGNAKAANTATSDGTTIVINTPATGSIRGLTVDGAFSPVDSALVCFQCFGDQ